MKPSHIALLLAALAVLPLLAGCATCRSRADAWIGHPSSEALAKFGPPDAREPVGPNTRLTWVRYQRVGDPWASIGRPANPLKSGAMPRGEAPSSRPIEPGGQSGLTERVGSLIISENGTVVAWSGRCEAFAPPSGFFSW